ncbi:protein of unknown function DUF11 [Actinobacteria bacterium OK074]|nr:protein of unknown function DUF11 [Actinobacteria bacterium OK074]
MTHPTPTPVPRPGHRHRRGHRRRRTRPWLLALPLAVAVALTAPAPAPAQPQSQTKAQPPSRKAAVTEATRTLPRSIPPGSEFTYTLTARNKGPSVARNVTVTDTLPAGVLFASSQDGCTSSGTTVTCGPAPELTVGQSRSWTFTAKLSPSYQGDGSDLGNYGRATADTSDPDSANNQNATGVKPPGPYDPVADLSTQKKPVGSGPVAPGETFEYTITTRNAGPSDAGQVTATDTLPAALSFVSSSDRCTAVGRTVTCGPQAVLAPGTSVSWTFKVRLDANYQGNGSDVQNTASATSTAKDPNPGNDTSTPVDPPGGVGAPQADLAAGKKPVQSTPVAPGETFDYAVTATNQGPSVARQVKATDPLPAQLTFVSSPDGCTASGQTVTCGPEATLAPGATKTWMFHVKLDSGYRGDGSDIQNIATVSSDTADPDPKNNTSDPAGPPGSSVNPPNADLSLTKVPVGSTPPVPGTMFDYRITVKNNGPSSDAYNVTLTDSLPPQLEYVSAQPDGCALTGATVACKRDAPLRVGDSAVYTLRVRLSQDYTGNGRDLTNTATVTADNVDPNTANDSATSGLPGGEAGTATADLVTVKKPVTTTPVAPGETYEYAVTVTNDGPSTARDVRISDRLPTQLSFVSSDDGCLTGQTVTCGPVSALAPGASRTWVFRVKLDPDYTGDGSDIRNTATATSSTYDPDEDNSTSEPSGVPGGRVNPPTADVEVDKETP